MSTFEKVQLVIKEVISMVINKEEKKKLSIGKKNCFSEMLKKKKKYKPLKDLKEIMKLDERKQKKKKKMFAYF